MLRARQTVPSAGFSGHGHRLLLDIVEMPVLMRRREHARQIRPIHGFRLMATPDKVTIFEGRGVAVQQRSTAILPSSNDLIRPRQAHDLHQRPALAVLRLVHTEEITGRVHLVIDCSRRPVRGQALAVAIGQHPYLVSDRCQCWWQ